jgi:hypothetical protein
VFNDDDDDDGDDDDNGNGINIYRLYVNGAGGGRRLVQIEMTCKTEIVTIAEYWYKI